MIRGYFLSGGGRRRPFIDAVLQFPTMTNRSFKVRLLVDTGADRTILSSLDASRLELEAGTNLTALPGGTPSTGIGGQVNTRTIEAVLTLDAFSTPLTLTVLEPLPGPLSPIPSLLGRDVLFRFALFMEERTRRVLLLEPYEADSLHLPS